MLSLREQLENLQKQAKNEESTEKNVKSVANELLQTAFGKLRGREKCIILDIEGIGVRLVPSTYNCISVDYLNPRNFYHFTLLTIEYDDTEYAKQILKETEEILIGEKCRIEHKSSYSFDAYF